MLLRRITKHVTDQNWFAVFIDFFIVVVGVFIGIQVANWNDARTLDSQERELLIELKREIESDATNANILRNHFENVHAAAKRSLLFMDKGVSCNDQCWSVLADFFHASHWFPVVIKRSVFAEMRRQGLPRSRDIVTAVEKYHSQNYNALVLDELPRYREVVRSILPVAVHEAYWSNCWRLEASVETIRYDDCPAAVSNDIAAQVVESIRQHPDIRTTLTFWLSEITPTAGELDIQHEAALQAIDKINAELGKK
ncbi:hypothetical protein [uncultured Paraglaciecola sp.]|uniref:hypothetical protein n=1 Tax=uncultured Paraglaciecola sp. TaxID=1765024 RepID=UPI00262410F7|nr:hypothetical protein [uncultured Paraglaciecola sp.]